MQKPKTSSEDLNPSYPRWSEEEMKELEKKALDTLAMLKKKYPERFKDNK